MDTIKTSKNTKEFYCELCDFNCSKKGDWNRHISRPKHLENQEMIHENMLNASKTSTHNKYVCKCGNAYSYHSGLYKHKKKCTKIHEPTLNDLKSHEKQQELIEYLLKENSEFKQLMIDQNKQMMELAKNITKETIIDK